MVNLRYGEGEAYHKLCIKALKLMREQSKVVESDQFKWISVKDRLPEANVLVLCRWDDFEGSYYGFARYQQHGSWYVANEGMPKVTHWMPLPEPPEVDV